MTDTSADDGWERYGRALLQAMQDVLTETPPEVHSLLLETADYWLSLGLQIGSSDAEAAERLLNVIEVAEPERAELADDAAQFVTESLG